MPYLCVDEGGEKVSPEQENEGEEADDCGAPTEAQSSPAESERNASASRISRPNSTRALLYIIK
jgi:hypothetical protein